MGRRATADFTDLHAWCEVYLPGAGWIGLDPTSGLFAGEGQSRSPDAAPDSAAPVPATATNARPTFSHSMRIERVWEAPRVTKPYTDAQWAEIEALGRRVDARLDAGDVRLTMGGEPTFVSVDDRDGAEWTTDALGPTKRLLAADLLKRLRDRYAPHGLLHLRPGQVVSRASSCRAGRSACYWRKDGEPLWSDPGSCRRALAARRDRGAGRALPAHGRAPSRARSELVFPAYEDVWYYLWRERKLPANVDPFDSRLEDPLERERLRRISYAGPRQDRRARLALQRDLREPGAPGSWFLREERCYLVPGDSPLGLRLPLDSLPGCGPRTRRRSMRRIRRRRLRDCRRVARCCCSARQTTRGRRARARRHSNRPRSSRAPRSAPSRATACSTSSCRRGSARGLSQLVAAVEATAADARRPVIVEGYEPPRDPRLESLRITPDPGVIEVNIHPAKSWSELVEHTTHLYEQARETRLTTEKFMLDGRHSGTGGGNHFVIGGATPADSPFLRRPDLLGSLVAYWHNHPSLSYLFSGMFLGPTSQHPRIDEARNDSVYEIEIALKELQQRSGGTVPPWLVDRLFRNLLIDATGNTHRAEFCIDKLYAPESATGRLGLLELRAFEMPPHARMSLTQQLLLRSLIARFWTKPYRPARLARWGTELHDRFMLPWFVWQDFGDVLEELDDAGFPLRRGLVRAAFRVPLSAHRRIRGARRAIRAAHRARAVARDGRGRRARRHGPLCRFVGRAAAGQGDRHRRRPAPADVQRACRAVAADRQRRRIRRRRTVSRVAAGIRAAPDDSGACAARLRSGRYLDAALDRRLRSTTSRTRAGATIETFPVNAYEAEGRRLARFFRIGHTPGGSTCVPSRATRIFRSRSTCGASAAPEIRFS
jgi:uncharacterized protein (DUF2126 family)